MRIIVCIKQVPKTDNAKVDRKTGTLIRTGVESVINPDDLYALEEALRIREQTPGTTVTVICMGSGDAEQSLREAMALGADDGILLSDRILAGSDAWATGNALSCALAKLGGPELILTGSRSSDAGSSQIAARISYALNLPLVSNAAQLSVQDGSLLAKQYTASKVTTVETPLPAVAAVAPEHTEVRTLTAAGIVDAYHLKTVSVWSAADVGVDPDRVGLSHSLSNVVGTWVPETHGNCELLPGTPADAAAALVARLTDRHILAEGRN